MTDVGFVAVAVASGIVAAVTMELWAGVLHRWIWHRALWPVHRSHHRTKPPAPGAQRSARAAAWEWNDALSVLHAPIAIALMAWGVFAAQGAASALAIGWGAGMTAFGFGYLVVHDGLVHGRLPVRFLERSGYLRHVRAAHVEHHRTNGVPHGLFLGPAAVSLARRRGHDIPQFDDAAHVGAADVPSADVPTDATPEFAS